MKCAGYPMKNRNETCLSNEKSQWNTQGYIWKIAMKGPGYPMKNCNEIPRDIFEKSQWNALGM